MGALPPENQLMPATSGPNGTKNAIADPMIHVCLVLSHHGPNAAVGCRAILISPAIPTMYIAPNTSQIAPKKKKNPIGNAAIVESSVVTY
jgi:hypothetical protein